MISATEMLGGTICYKKNIDYTWLHSCYVLFCFLRNLKKHALVDTFYHILHKNIY